MHIRALILLSLLAIAPLAVAQQHPIAERGFKADGVYAFNGFDTVNLFNGNLIGTIPLASYPVSNGLSYSFVLRYSGQVWTGSLICPHPNDPNPECRRVAYPQYDNLGLGWRLSFGTLTPQWMDYVLTFRYDTPDGSQHLFYDTLHDPPCSATVTTNCDAVTAGIRYSRDGSYLRLREVSSTVAVIEFGNGERHRFEKFGGEWKLTYIYNASSALDSNGIPTSTAPYVKFTYATDLVTVRDTHGRTHYVRSLSQSGVGAVIKEIDLQQFGGVRALYQLTSSARTINQVCHMTDDFAGTGVAWFFEGLNLPSGESWQFIYENDLRSECYDASGTLRSARLPTGGTIEWLYGLRTLGGINQAAMSVIDRATRETSGVQASRIRYDYSAGATTVQHDALVSGTWRADWKTRNHFQTLWDHNFGLPFTTSAGAGSVGNPDSSSKSRYLSTETFDCDQNTGTCSGTADRATYVRYEMNAVGNCGVDSPCWRERDRRVYTERTLYVGDGVRYADANHSRFDGVGHYRQTDLSGNFDSGNTRTTKTEYNPAVGNYQLDGSGNRTAGYTMLSASAPWLLNTYPESSVTEGVTEKKQYCFDATKGTLLRQRMLAGTTPGATDVLSVFTYDTPGNVTRERRYGADTQALSTTADVCAASVPSSDQVRMQHTWSAGDIATSQYTTSSGGSLGFLTTDDTIDSNSGLVSSSRDISGLATNFEYDAMGRLRWSKPVSGGWTEYVYTNAAGLSPAQVEMREWNQGASVVMGRSQWIYDSFGRIAKEKRLMPNGSWSTKAYRYNAAGLREFVSETEASDNPSNGTTFRKFDPYGRPGEVVAADGTITAFAYQGVRQTDRTRSVRTGGTASSFTYSNSTTTEIYDRQGRLFRVSEPSGASGAQVTTEYTYDQGNRVKRVKTTAAEGIQYRYFNYDRRGFLTSEQHPEKGATGNGTVTYSSFDAAGRALRRVDGPSDLRFTYDRAGRLTRVEEGTGRVWKEFTYSTLNNWSKGKLSTATRHNYFDRFGTNATITETYAYNGVGGRVSQRDTYAYTGTSFTQYFDYDDRGRPITITYPRCTGFCNGLTGDTVTNVYTNGLLTSVPRYANAITYHSNGMVADVTFANNSRWTQVKDPYSMVRPASIATTGTTSNWSSGTYKYDGSGNITAIGSDYYLYDHVSRVTRGTSESGSKSQQYTFDTFGNMTSMGGQAIATSAATNRLTATGFAYDTAGNATQWEGINYEYDPFGMVRAKHDNYVTMDWVYVYTADDERIWSYDLGPNNTSWWNVRDLGGKVLSEFINPSDTWTAVVNYAYRDGALLGTYSPQRPTGSQYNFFAPDHLGTPRQIIASNGSSLAKHAYFPFGQETTPRTADGEKMKFTGHERDFGTNSDTKGLVDYMHARYYGTLVGRFLSVDPGKDWDSKQPQSWNMYSYVRNNPVNQIDPDGRAIETPWDIANVLLDVASLASNVASGNVLGAVVDAAGLIYDGAATAVPGLPAGAGTLIKAARATDKIDDVADVAKAGRAGRQARLRQLADDPKVASADRGWIKQDVNQIDRGKRSSIRTPPGKELAHERGREAAKGYSHKHSNLQDKDLHKTQHKYDDRGRKNKERPLEPK